MNFGADFFDQSSNDPFSERLVPFGSQASPNNRKNNEISTRAPSIFDNVLGCNDNQNVIPFSSKSMDAPINGVTVNSSGSIDSSRSSPTSSLSGSSGTPGFSNSRIQKENFNSQGSYFQKFQRQFRILEINRAEILT